MSKLFNKKDVYSWSNLEDAKKYIGEEGYFCDGFTEDLGAWHKGLLQDVNQSMPVDYIFEDEENEVFGLFLPADKVKQSKKKFRPFQTVEEFSKTLGIKELLGAEITFRFKEKPQKIHVSVITEKGFWSQENITTLDSVVMGGCDFTMNELFTDWEWLKDGSQWQPFGVLEDENRIRKNK